MKLMIVGFVAPKQHGKTTACNILKEHWGEDVVQINFKDALVQELKDNFPDLLDKMVEMHMRLNYKEITGINDLFHVKPPLMRALMQNYGTEVRRGDDDEYWTDEWTRTAFDEAVVFEGRNIVCDDVRFNNEASSVRDNKGILIRLVRSDLTTNDTHQSETEQTEIVCDYTITTGKGEEDKLKEELLEIIKHGV